MVDRPYAYDVRASDPDRGEVLTYRLVAAPSGMSIDGAKGWVRWTPTLRQAGYTSVAVEVSDSTGRLVYQRFKLFVGYPANRTPVITSTPRLTAVTETEYLSQVTAVDADGDLLVYHLELSPPGMTVNPAAGLISWTPERSQAGAFLVQLRVDDLRGGIATQQFAVNVTRLNRAPTVTAGPDRQAQLALSQVPPSNGPFELIPLSTGFNGVIGVDYHAPSNRMLLSVNYPGGGDHNFELVNLDGSREVFSNVRGLSDEVKIATARDDGDGRSLGGFLAGEMFVGSGVPGVIVRIGADGKTVRNPWVTLPGEAGLIRGSLHVDRTGVFAGDLLVVTTSGGVWRISEAGLPSRLAQLNTHLEGMAVVPPDATRYGPWAGTLLAGAENYGGLFAITPAGTATHYNVGFNPEDIDLVVPNENFFAVDYAGGRLMGAPATAFGEMVGDLVMVQESPGRLYRVRWNGTSFESTLLAQVSQFEHAAFGPAGITPVPPVSTAVTMAGHATDDGEPAGSTLATTWAQVSGPRAVAFSNAAVLTPTVTFNAAGNYVLRLTATDGVLHASDDVVITVTDVNHAPTITSAPVTSALATRPYRYRVTAADIDPGDTLTFQLVSGPSGAAIVASTGVLSWTPGADQAGVHPFTVAVIDAAGASGRQSFSVDVAPLPPNRPPSITSTAVTDAAADIAYRYQVEATDPDLQDVVVLSLVTAPAAMKIDPAGLITWTPAPTDVGSHTVVVRATDLAGEFVEQAFSVTVAPPDTTAPTVSIESPLTGAKLDNDVDIVGTVFDDHLESWTLSYRVPGTSTWLPLGSGTTNVTSGVLGRLPATLLANNPYRLLLTGWDGKQSNAQEIEVYVDTGALKLGDFTLEFEDLRVPGPTFPIRLLRKYDTKHPEPGDFGPGWTLSFSGVDVRTAFDYDVFITLPNGRRVSFNHQPYGGFFGVYTNQYVAQPGTYDTLENTDCPQLFGAPGNFLCNGFQRYTPQNYVLRTKEGMTYTLTASGGIRRIEDRNGNALDITAGGITSSWGINVAIERDPAGRIVRIVEPDGTHGVTYAYDETGHLASFFDQTNAQTKFFYEQPAFPHYLTRIDDPLGRPAVRGVYDDSGRLIAQCNANGNPATLEGCVKFTPDGTNRVLTTYNARGFRTDLEMDARGNVLVERRYLEDGRALSTVNTYDAANNLLTTTDPAGNVRAYTYDAGGNRLTETDPGGRTTARTYNACGKVVTETDPANHTTAYEYDAACNLTKVTDAMGGVTRYEYNAAGQRSAFVDPVGSRWTWTYAANGLPTRVTDPFGKFTQLTFSPAGDLVTRIDRKGQRIDFEYDAKHRLVRETWNTSPMRVTVYTYDARGALTAAVDPDSSLVFTYTDVGQVSSVDNTGTSGVPAVRMTYGYDEGGNIASVADSLGGVTSYRYDAVDRLSSAWQAGTGVNEKRVDFSYDSSSALTGARRFASLAGTTRVADTTYEYGCSGCEGRLAAIIHLKATGDVIDALRFDRDSVGNITSAFDRFGEHQYKYDAMRRLLSAAHPSHGPLPDENYSYDAAGNRVSGPSGGWYVYSYQAQGPGQQLLQDARFDYEYDSEGNVAKRTERSTGVREFFRFDHKGRLTTHTRLAATGETLGRTEYAWDTLNRRIREADGAGSAAWVYDSLNPVLVFSSGSSSYRRRFSAQAVDAFIAEESLGKTRWFTFDPVGTVRGFIEDGGTWIPAPSADSFGLAGSGQATDVGEIGFGSREFSPGKTFGLFRRRLYEPNLGRFLSEDPVAPFGYPYSDNNPLAFKDPLGANSVPEYQVIIGSLGVMAAPIYAMRTCRGYDPDDPDYMACFLHNTLAIGSGGVFLAVGFPFAAAGATLWALFNGVYF